PLHLLFMFCFQRSSDQMRHMAYGDQMRLPQASSKMQPGITFQVSWNPDKMFGSGSPRKNRLEKIHEVAQVELCGDNDFFKYDLSVTSQQLSCIKIFMWYLIRRV
ncbi:hypothetical protein ACJX0J_015782, partial [Zea mays]